MDAKTLLKHAGLKSTRPQLAVLSALFEADNPLSREEILEKLAATKMDPVTVYRILERFIEHGLVHKVFIQERAWRYELAHHCSEKQCHPHFICNNCQRIYCLKNQTVPLIDNLESGFVLQRQQVRIEGLCPACSKTG